MDNTATAHLDGTGTLWLGNAERNVITGPTTGSGAGSAGPAGRARPVMHVMLELVVDHARNSGNAVCLVAREPGTEQRLRVYPDGSVHPAAAGGGPAAGPQLGQPNPGTTRSSSRGSARGAAGSDDGGRSRRLFHRGDRRSERAVVHSTPGWPADQGLNVADHDRSVGPTAPQAFVELPTAGLRLPLRGVSAVREVWVVGAHGGAGESSIAGLGALRGGSWGATDRSWPAAPPGMACPCVLVARTNVRGMLAAQAALTQWAAGGSGPSARLLGLVWVADAPGRLPAPLRDLAGVVGGGAPRVWEVPWLTGWRVGDPVTDHLPRTVHKLVGDLRSLASRATAPDAPIKEEN